MFCLQACIGATNDIADVALDAGTKPGKPLPRGLVSRRAATWLAVGAGVVGLALSVPSGPAVTAAAVVGLAIGLAYDLRLKGTAWSWAGFAVGVPLLPAYAWLGAAGSLPPAFLVLLPTAVVAGAALALANLQADADRDAAAGVITAATVLGPWRTWLIGTALLAVVVVLAASSLVALGGGGPAAYPLLAGVGILSAGVAVGRGRTGDLAERAWELEAAGVGVLAAAWLAALAGTTAL
jgi:4-hydroxybenzoate polyprenyltransferase